MSFWISACIAAGAVCMCLKIQNNFCAGTASSSVVSIDIACEIVRPLSFGAPDLVGLTHELVDFEATSGAEHNDGVAKRNLCVARTTVSVGNGGVLLKSERMA